MVKISAYNNGTAYLHSTAKSDGYFDIDTNFNTTYQTYSNFQRNSFDDERRARCRVGTTLSYVRTSDDSLLYNYNFIPDECVYSLQFNEASSSDNYALGETCSSSVTLKVHSSFGANFAVGCDFYPFIVVNDGDVEKEDVYCPLGVFYVYECSSEGEILTVTAYDKMSALSDPYECATATKTVTGILNDIANQYDFELASSISNSTSMYPVANSTAREMIGYIAGYLGCNAVFDRWGKLAFRKPCLQSTVDHYVLTEEDIYEGGFANKSTGAVEGSSVNPKIQKVGMLISGSGENEIKYGSGNYCLFVNPYIETESELRTIYTNLEFPITYSPCSISYKGCAVWEVGDTISVNIGTDYYNVMIMSHTLECSSGGGLKGTIECFGLNSTSQDAIANCNVEKVKLERNISKLESMQDAILGATGGCYDLLLDGYDKPYGTAWWKDASKTTGWKFTYGGLGFFKNNTLQHIGITNDGSVLADNITANSIITNSFTIGKSGSDYAMSFDGSTGKINFGSGVSMSWADITDTPTIPTSTSELTNDSGYITDGDIPTKTSDLTNDSGFINRATATTITNNAISTASISANQITTGTLSADRVGAGSFTMTGGSIKVETDASDTSVIKLSYEGSSAEFSPDGIWLDLKHATTGQTIYTSMMTSTSIYLSNSSGNTQIAGGSIQLDGSDVITTASLSDYGFYSAGDDIKVGEIKSSTTYNDTVSYATNMYIGTTGILHRTTKTSSRDVKHDIAPLTDATINAERLYDVGVIQFKYNDDVLSSGDERYDTLLPGFIVEDMINAYPMAVDVEDGKAFQWNEQYLIPPMLKLIQDQHKEITDLQNRIEVLENGLSTND